MEFETYQTSQDTLNALTSKLPKDLVAKLAREVITRVATRSSADRQARIAPSAEAVEDFARLLISPDPMAGANFISDIQEDGVSPETVYLVYLASAARQLGAWWESDDVSFFDVTVGTSRIVAIMRAMRHHFVAPGQLPSKTALFATVPGEDHSLGVIMATDFLRKDAWDIDLMTGLDHDRLIDVVSNRAYPIIGLSIAGEHSIPALTRAVIALRIASPASYIVVGGQDIRALEVFIDAMGVDAVVESTEDARQALDTIWTEIEAA